MGNCPACHGVIGLECFNPEECMEITRLQAMEYQRITSDPMLLLTRSDFAALILKGIVCGLKWEMLPNGERGWRWDGYLRDAEVKELCAFAREEFPLELRTDGHS
jgi:hypothetical protein